MRLVLRKPNQWHPISALREFEKEVGEEGLQSSIVDLCQPINYFIDTLESVVKREFVDPDVPVKVEDDSREGWGYNAEAGPSRVPVPGDPVQTVVESNPAELDLGFFCEDENNMTLEDILWRLHKDQLSELVKLTRCKLPTRPKV